MRDGKIFNRVFSAISLLLVIVVAVTAWMFIRVLKSAHERSAREKLEATALVLRPLVFDALEKKELPRLRALVKRLGGRAEIRITVINPDGVVLAESTRPEETMGNHADRPEFLAALSGGMGGAKRYSATLERNTMYLALPVPENGKPLAVLRTSVTVSTLDRELRPRYLAILAGGLLTVLIAGFIAYFISRGIAVPLERLTKASAAIQSDKPVFPPFHSGIFELDSLGKALGDMAISLKDRISEVEKGRKELDLILTKMREGVVAMDENDEIILLNPAAARIFEISTGFPAGGADGRAYKAHFKELIRDDSLHCFVEELKSGHSFQRVEIELAGIAKRVIDVQGDVLKTPDGRVVGYLLVINDITKMKELMNMRRNFAANVSHELKTPLTVIQGLVETLLDGAKDSPETAEKFLKTIKKHTERLTALINDVMSLSMVESAAGEGGGEKSSVPLSEIIGTAADLCHDKASGRGVSIRVECPTNLNLIADVRMLEQVFVNLIDNAVKFSPENGVVKVDAVKSADFAVVTVADNGCGIPMKHIPFIFERFYRCDKGRGRGDGGTGLGLAIVKHAAQFHGGTVSVKSEPGKQTVFTVKLPVS